MCVDSGRCVLKIEEMQAWWRLSHRDYGPIEGIWLRSILLVARLYFILWYGRYNSLRENVEMSE